jgi:hypothetical protein
MNKLIAILLLSVMLTACNYSILIPKSQVIHEITGYAFTNEFGVYFLPSKDSSFNLGNLNIEKIYSLKFPFSNYQLKLIDTLGAPVSFDKSMFISQNKELVASYIKIRYWDEKLVKNDETESMLFDKSIRIVHITGKILYVGPKLHSDLIKHL